MQSFESIQEILDALNRDDIKAYPRDVLDAALQHEVELTPHLIGILEEVLADYPSFIDRGWFFGHVFAMQLLAHFGNTDAHKTIVGLMSLPRDAVDYLFGDMITEDFPRILYRTCGGDYREIRALALNKETDEFVRGSALRALVWGVIFGDLPRSEALDFFGGLFTGSESEELSHYWGDAASCVRDLYPEELMGTIRDAYTRGLIWPGDIGMEHFDRTLSKDKASVLEKTKETLEESIREDFHSYMSWWACLK